MWVSKFYSELKNSSFLKISYFGFLATLPLVYTEELMDPALLPRQVYLSLFLLGVWLFLIFKKRNELTTILVSKLSYILVIINSLLVILAIVSIFYAHLKSESIFVSSKIGITYLFSITTYFLISMGLLKQSDLTKGVYAFLLVSLTYGIYDVFNLWQNNLSILSNSAFIKATYANKNLFASILILCFFALFVHHKNKIVTGLLLVVFIFFIILLQSKIVVFVFFMISFLMAFVYFKNRGSANIRATKALVLFFFISVICIIGFNSSSFENLSNTHTLVLRLAAWKNSFSMINEFPFGVGSGNWQVYFTKYGVSHFDIDSVKKGVMTFQRPHNDFIWVWCELGIQGLVLYLTFFTLLLYMLVKVFNATKTLSSYLLAISTVGYMLIAFFDFPLERMEHQLLLAVITVMAMNNYDRLYGKTKPLIPLKAIPIFLMLIGFSLVVCCYRLKGEYYTRAFILMSKKTNPDRVIENAEKSKSLFYDVDFASLPIDFHIAKALAFKNKPLETKEKLEKAYQLMPYNIKVLNNLGKVHVKLNENSQASIYFEKLLKISPSFKIEEK